MRTFLLILISAIFLFACAHEQSLLTMDASVAKSGIDSVKILTISPDLTETFKVGSTVKIRYEVQYNLASADTGSITLVVQGASNETLGNEFYIIHKGSGTEVLEAEIVVPDTRAVQVFTPLSPQGSSSTSIVESRLYKVER